MTERIAGVAVHDLGGPDGAPPLLISHATGLHARAYRVVAAALGRRFHTWGLDHRGHGVTPVPEGGVADWSIYGADAGAVARELADRSGVPVVGFGHSMGGTALLMAAHADPAAFDRLVLFEPIGSPDRHVGLGDTEVPLAAGARRRRSRFDSFDAAYANYASKPPLDALDPQALRDYVDFGFREVADPDGSTHVELLCTPDHEADTFLGGAAVAVWDLLGELAVPVTVIGSGDGEMPARVAPRFAEAIPGAEFVYVPDQNHFGPLTHPAAVAELIAR